jgi:serine/threonine protein phosphatase PrpC
MIRFHARSHPGIVRPHNEDAMLADGGNGVFVVADGVGGRAAGEVASALTIETVENAAADLSRSVLKYANTPEWEGRNEVLEHLDQVCQFSSKRVFDEADRLNRKGMTTTLVLLVVGGGTAFLAHVGDSRAYLIRDGLIQQLTDDHSMVNELVRTGQMSLEEAKRSQYRNVITRAIGLYPSVQADVMAIDILPGDRIVMCSDGLSDPVAIREIEAMARQDDVETATDRLLDAALQAGAPDNVTVAVIEPEATPQAEAARARAQVMADLFLFEDLPFHARLRVARICEARIIQPGEILAREGEPGDAMYIIAQGKVVVNHQDTDIAVLKAGEHFGEISLLDAEPRSATVTSQEAGSVIVIRRDALTDFTKRDPDLGGQVYMRLATTLAQRLRQANERMTDTMPTITM